MTHGSMDRIDEGILYQLQDDARRNTTSEIGDAVGVAASTVADRIRKLEDRGIITGYDPTIDYEKAGYENHVVVTGTAPFPERAAVAEATQSVDGVVAVRELLTNRHNITAELVAPSRRELERSIEGLHGVDLDVEVIQLAKREFRQPFDHFGAHAGDDPD